MRPCKNCKALASQKPWGKVPALQSRARLIWIQIEHRLLILQGPAAPAPDLDIATLLATFPPDVREEVLLTSDQTMLASLTPALLAEAQVT